MIKPIVLLFLLMMISCQESISINEEVQGIVVPADLSPEHKYGSTSFASDQERLFASRIRNFGGETTGPVSFNVQKMQVPIDLYFYQSDTSYVIGVDTVHLDNPQVTFIEQAVRYKFTIPSIPPGGQVVIGYKLKACATCTGSAILQTTVINGTGGETNFSNNIKITQLSINQ